MRLQPVEARHPNEIDRTFVAMVRERAGGLLVLPDVMFPAHGKHIADLTAKNRIPAVYGHLRHAEAESLIVYGVNVFDLYRRAATYVDKILKGAKPADLPVGNRRSSLSSSI